MNGAGKPLFMKTYGKLNRKLEAWISPDNRKQIFASNSSSDQSIAAPSSPKPPAKRGRKRSTADGSKATRPAKTKALSCLREKDSDEENIFIVPPPPHTQTQQRTNNTARKPLLRRAGRKARRTVSSSESDGETTTSRRPNPKRSTAARDETHTHPTPGKFVTHRRGATTAKHKVSKRKLGVLLSLNSSDDFIQGGREEGGVVQRSFPRRAKHGRRRALANADPGNSGVTNSNGFLRDISLNESPERSVGPCHRKPLFSSTPSSRPLPPSLLHPPVSPSASDIISLSTTHEEDPLRPSPSASLTEPRPGLRRLSSLGQAAGRPEVGNREEPTPRGSTSLRSNRSRNGGSAIQDGGGEQMSPELFSAVASEQTGPDRAGEETEGGSHFVSATVGQDWLAEVAKERCLTRCCVVRLARVDKPHGDTTYSSCVDHTRSHNNGRLTSGQSIDQSVIGDPSRDHTGSVNDGLSIDRAVNNGGRSLSRIVSISRTSEEPVRVKRRCLATHCEVQLERLIVTPPHRETSLTVTPPHRETSLIVTPPHRETSLAVTPPHRETSLTVTPPHRETSLTVTPPHRETSLTVTPPHRETSLTVTPPHRGTSLTVTPPHRGTSLTVTRPHRGTSLIVTRPHRGTSLTVTRPHRGTSLIVTPPHRGTSLIVTRPHRGTSLTVTRPHRGTSLIVTRPHRGTSLIVTRPHRGTSLTVTRPHRETSLTVTPPHRETSLTVTPPHRETSLTVTQPHRETSLTVTPPHREERVPKETDSLVPKECVPKDSLVPKECVPKDSLVPKECVPKDSLVPKENVPKDSLVPKENVPKDSLVPKENVPKDSLVPKEDVPKDSLVPKENVPKDSLVPKENVPKDSLVPKERVPKEKDSLVLKERVPKEKDSLVLKENVPKDSLVPKERVPKEKDSLVLKENVPKDSLVLKERVPKEKDSLVLKERVPKEKDSLVLKERVPKEKDSLVLKERVPKEKDSLVLKERVPKEKDSLVLKERVPKEKDSLVLKERVPKDVPNRRKMGGVPKERKRRSVSQERPATSRKACVSGVSVSRWGRRDGAPNSRAAPPPGRAGDCSITELLSAQHTHRVSSLSDSVVLGTPVRGNRVHLSSLLVNLTPETHTWSRLKAALSLHRKTKTFLTPKRSRYPLSSPEAALGAELEAELGDVSQKLFCTPRRTPRPPNLRSQIRGSTLLSVYSLGGELSDDQKVYSECNQTGPLGFQDCLPAARMKLCRKIGEGTFGEVFSTTNASGDVVALKIIPVEGCDQVNGEDQKTFGEILHEIIISKELSRLKEKKHNQTTGFIGLKDLHCVQGCYPPGLLKAWDSFNTQRGSENDRPDFFSEEQMFLILEFEFGGSDLENSNGQLASVLVAKSILHQVTAALAVAEQELCFEHRDLHWGNVLVQSTKEKEGSFLLNGTNHSLETRGVSVRIIDYSLSRLEIDGLTVSCDISEDEELFQGNGDYQFDIYRLMRQENSNMWSDYHPFSNVLWLHYLCSKLLTMTYKGRGVRGVKQARVDLQRFHGDVLTFRSASDVLYNCGLFQ
ncbi:uncharacterized protein haspin isoform X2 [Salvelinus alpinus]|uniref:uncharacterized protein haspin isoform X2 n=1 Tax=Salvelinus alpinus TaxID=8036 RepID=UPI0039FDCAC6